jgi:hypothetical protein
LPCAESNRLESSEAEHAPTAPPEHPDSVAEAQPTTVEGALHLAIKLALDARDYERAASLLEVARRDDNGPAVSHADGAGEAHFEPIGVGHLERRREPKHAPEIQHARRKFSRKAVGAERSGEASTAVHGNERSGNDDARLMERVVERGNVLVALKRVAPGGSRAMETQGPKSDWDLGVYYRGVVDTSALAAKTTVYPPGAWGRIMNGGAVARRRRPED